MRPSTPSTPSETVSRLASLAVASLLVAAAVVGTAPGVAVADGSGVSDPSAASQSTVGVGSSAGATICTAESDSAGETSVTDHSPNGTTPVPNESRDTTVARGDLAVVPLSVPAGANVTVTVGTDSNYTARLRVGDDGDGSVRLVVNTYLAGNGSSVDPDTFAVAGDDTVSILGGNATAPLAPSNYTVTVAQNGSFVGERRLTVTEPVVEGVTLRRAAPQLFDAENASVLRAAEETDLVRQLRPDEYAPEAVSGETVLIRLDAPSLLGVLAAQDGETATERFLQLRYHGDPRSVATFDIYSRCTDIQLDEVFGAGGGRVVVDHRNGSIYVLLDSNDIEERAAGPPTFVLDGDSDEPVGAAVGEVRRKFRIEQDELVVERDPWIDLSATENATVSGTTKLLPGSEIVIHVSSRVDSTFDRTITTTVGPDGQFTATVDLSTVSTPNSFLVRVGDDSFQGRIGTLPWIHWTLSGPDRGENQWIDADEFGLDGGFLVVYELTESGVYEGVGVLEDDRASLEVETGENASRFFVVAHRDGNDNGEFDGIETDPPYTVESGADGRETVLADWLASTRSDLDAPSNPPPFDPATVSMPFWMREDESETPTETPSGTVTTTPTTTAPTPRTTTPPPTGTTQPGADSPTTTATRATTATTDESPGTQTTTGTDGFGAAVALTALLAAVAVLAGRRQQN